MKKLGLAVFDFDGTLIERDSLLIFLGLVSTPLRSIWLLVSCLVFEGFKFKPEFKTRAKSLWLEMILKNKSQIDLEQAIKALPFKVTWKLGVVEQLRFHYAQGHDLLIATGALEIYMRPLLKELSALTQIPLNALHLRATELEIQNKKFTGHILGPNCVRGAKAKIVSKFMKEHGPYTECWGYGNSPNDLHMLKILKHKIVV